MKAGRLGFGEGVLDAGKKYDNLVVLGADITASVGLNLFKEHFPSRFFSMGIAEQNIAASAAGMALSGLIPVSYTHLDVYKRQHKDWVEEGAPAKNQIF